MSEKVIYDNSLIRVDLAADGCLLRISAPKSGDVPGRKGEVCNLILVEEFDAIHAAIHADDEYDKWCGKHRPKE